MLAIISQNTYSFAYNNGSPTQLSLDGSQSQDTQGRTIASNDCAITQFEWILLSKPDGATDPNISASGTLGEIATITIPAGIVGGYLYLLRVYEGTDFSSPTLDETPNSALAGISFRSENLGLHVLAEGTRNHGDRSSENLILLDNAINSNTVNIQALAPTPVATTTTLGKSKLSEINDPQSSTADPAQPIVVNADGEKWRTLTENGVATGYHTHPEYQNSGGGGTGGTGTGGRHHHLRPDLLTGDYDRVWSENQTEWGNAEPMLGSLTNSIIAFPNRHHSLDYNLLVDTYNDSSLSNQRALTVVKLQDIANLGQPMSTDIWAVMDLRIQPVHDTSTISQKRDAIEGVGVSYEAMFVGEFYDANDSSRTPLFEVYGGTHGTASRPLSSADVKGAMDVLQAQDTTVAVGYTMDNWSNRATEFGTAPFTNTFNGDEGQSVPILTKRISQGFCVTDCLFGIRLRNGIARTYISISGGGWTAIGDPTTITNDFNAVRFYMAGTSGSSSLGLRMETTGLRVIMFAQDIYGLTPNYNSYGGYS